MRQPTVYTSPGERPKFNFLLTENYLSEFRSEIDKARVRQNLGIPDNYNLYWGNIKGNIRNQLDLISLLDKDLGLSQINANIHNLQAYVLNHEAYIKALGDVTEISKLVTDIRQNATNISNLTLKVNQLMNGSNTEGGTPSYPTTDYSQDINTLKTNVQTIISDVSTLKTNMQTVLSQSATISRLESKVSEVDSKVTALESRIAALESTVNGPILTRIYASQTNISITTEGNSIINIYAEYSNNSSVEITNTCNVSFSNNSIANYSNGTITPLIEGYTKITFTYNGKTCEVELTVTNSQPEVVAYPQYIGFATSPSQIFENTTFKVDNISGDWSGKNIHTYGTTDIYGIFIITTQNIQSIDQSGLAIDLTEANKGTLLHSTNGQTYTIYMAGTTTNPNDVAFKITT